MRRAEFRFVAAWESRPFQTRCLQPRRFWKPARRNKKARSQRWHRAFLTLAESLKAGPIQKSRRAPSCHANCTEQQHEMRVKRFTRLLSLLIGEMSSATAYTKPTPDEKTALPTVSLIVRRVATTLKLPPMRPSLQYALRQFDICGSRPPNREPRCTQQLTASRLTPLRHHLISVTSKL